MIGYGMLTWDPEERQRDRYGSVKLTGQDSKDDESAKPYVNHEALEKLQDKRVRLWAKVMETRKSDHIGDLFLGLSPSTPEVGEVIELGVGVLRVETDVWDNTVFVLQPEDGRETFWIDPRLLYRLHEQTVELYAEETTDACHAAPDLTSEDTGVAGIGDGEGGFQTKGVEVEDIERIDAQVELLGDGMFMLKDPDYSLGSRPDFTLKPGRKVRGGK